MTLGCVVTSTAVRLQEDARSEREPGMSFSTRTIALSPVATLLAIAVLTPVLNASAPSSAEPNSSSKQAATAELESDDIFDLVAAEPLDEAPVAAPAKAPARQAPLRRSRGPANPFAKPPVRKPSQQANVHETKPVARQLAPIGPVAEQDVFTLLGGRKRSPAPQNPIKAKPVEPAAKEPQKLDKVLPPFGCQTQPKDKPACDASCSKKTCTATASCRSSCPDARPSACPGACPAPPRVAVSPLTGAEVVEITDEPSTNVEPQTDSFDVGQMLSGSTFSPEVDDSAASQVPATLPAPVASEHVSAGATSAEPMSAEPVETKAATPDAIAPKAEQPLDPQAETANSQGIAPLAEVEYRAAPGDTTRAATADYAAPGLPTNDVFLLVTGDDGQPSYDSWRVAAKQTEQPRESDAANQGAAGSKKKPPARPAPKLVSIFETTVDLTPRTQMIDGEETSAERPADMAVRRYGDYAGASVGGNEWVRFAVQDYLWASPAMRHKPLYFEQPNLERYGNHVGGTCLASVAATGHFVGSVLSLPYQIGAQPPRECVYTLGVYRPGSCNPHYFHASPISCKGMLTQGAAVTGLVFLFP